SLPACAGSSSCRSSVVLQVQGWGKQPDLTGNPSMTTQPLARYGARNGALASGLTTSVTPRPGTRPYRPPEEDAHRVIQAALWRVKTDTRTPFQRALGDPPPGRSALDQKLGPR